MLNTDQMKVQAALAALKYINDEINLGIGSGSTVKCFISVLASKKKYLKAVVSSSTITTKLLKEVGITTSELNNVGQLDYYIDGADQINPHFQMIKGGGAALTREKIIAAASKTLICIADQSKQVESFNQVVLAIEVIPMARSYVAREMVKLGGTPVWREGVLTDNGNWILDIYNLNCLNPITLETTINNIAGVVSNGIFAHRPADQALIAKSDGEIITLIRK